MGLIKEPKNIDLSTKSVPWADNELTDFRKIMAEIKLKNKKKQVSDKVLFPEKLAKANEILEKVGLPKKDGKNC